jgi:hypothetical protein
VICAYDECDNEFEPRTHNQKYCSDECCRTATNIKIKQKYYEKKERLSGKLRICKSHGCKTILSRYSESTICTLCELKDSNKKKMNLLKELGLAD